MIPIALASNAAYFPGLAVTLVSLLRANPTHLFSIHIIDGGITQPQRRLLERSISADGRPHEIQFHRIDHSAFAGFAPDHGNSYMAYARILVGTLLNIDRVLYLDTDLLVCGDIGPLWEMDLEGDLAAAAQDPNIQWLRNDYPFADPCDSERYFNTGVMIIDLAKWRARGVQQLLLTAIAAQPKAFKWWDQTAMNALLRGQVRFIDSGWNTFADRLALDGSHKAKIFHYVGPIKPWMRYMPDLEYRMWRLFHRRYVRGGTTILLRRSYLASYFRHVRHVALEHLPLRRARRAVMSGQSARATEPRSASQASHRAAIDAFAAQTWGPALAS